MLSNPSNVLSTYCWAPGIKPAYPLADFRSHSIALSGSGAASVVFFSAFSNCFFVESMVLSVDRAPEKWYML
jgi:hypothetical protein